MLRRNRTWVILHQPYDSNVWVQYTAMVAPTRRAAINQARKGSTAPYDEGRYRAIDVRHWGAVIVVPSEASTKNPAPYGTMPP